MSPAEIDIVLKADPKTVRVVPWAAEPTAQVIHDCFYSDGRQGDDGAAPAAAARADLYAERGWEPVIAPELEFYLVEPNIDADYQLKPPIGRSGRAEPGRQSYSIAAVNEFDPLFDDMYAFCEAQDIEIDTLIHEDGPAQMEINLLHGDPLAWPTRRSCSSAPRAKRRCATRCTRPSWPSRTPRSRAAPCTSTRAWSTRRPGRTSSAIRTARPRRCSSRTSPGLQRYLPAAMSLFAPNVNSYRRMTRASLAPINVQWGYDNRTAGLRCRCRIARSAARREPPRRRRRQSLHRHRRLARLRLPRHGRKPAAERADHRQRARPALGPAALARRGAQAPADCEPLVQSAGLPFVAAYSIVKQAEYEVFLQVISSWEREHLLLNV
jgi:glutamine synthetase